MKRLARRCGAMGVIATLMLGPSGMAFAAETITYSYDSKGRLVKVVRSVPVNNGVVTEYQKDKANNRTRLKVAGSPN